jgi:predicted secreted hydrolase
LNRAGPGLAGADFTSHRVWNGNWLVQWKSLAADTQELQAVCDRFSLFLDLTPAKPFVIHGKDGVSVKGPAPGEASHYISFTRLLAKGQLSGQPVSGVAWMDHEFFTSPSAGSLAGWDWFAVQLDNDEELMLYRLRDKSGEPDAYSSGTFVDAKGGTRFLSAADFLLSPSGLWQSPDSRARYPIAWEISVPSLGLHLSETTSLASQELFTPRSVSPTYWEGAVNYSGEIHGQAIKGVGYLEMTGYQK